MDFWPAIYAMIVCMIISEILTTCDEFYRLYLLDSNTVLERNWSLSFVACGLHVLMFAVCGGRSRYVRVSPFLVFDLGESIC